VQHKKLLGHDSESSFALCMAGGVVELPSCAHHVHVHLHRCSWLLAALRASAVCGCTGALLIWHLDPYYRSTAAVLYFCRPAWAPRVAAHIAALPAALQQAGGWLIIYRTLQQSLVLCILPGFAGLRGHRVWLHTLQPCQQRCSRLQQPYLGRCLEVCWQNATRADRAVGKAAFGVVVCVSTPVLSSVVSVSMCVSVLVDAGVRTLWRQACKNCKSG
jgi:hypothetical protein